MTTGGLSHDDDGLLLGVELGRNKVRLALLGGRTGPLLDAVERPIPKAGGPRDPIEQEFATRSAIEDGLDRLELDAEAGVSIGATIGFPNCGVGSGPALEGWLESLSEDIAEPVLFIGDTGVSYAPASCIDFVERVFESTGLTLSRVELAPVAAARVLTSIRSGAIALGSGVAWSARLLNNQVLEAFETADGGFDDELQVVINGVGETVVTLDGFDVDQSFGPTRGLSPAVLAPAVGVAVALLDLDGPNLLYGRQAGTKVDAVAEGTLRAGSGEVASPPPVDTVADPWADFATGFAPDEAPDSRLQPHPDTLDPRAEHPLDDLGAIQAELRAHRADDTHQLRGLPRRIERSRELGVPEAASRPVPKDDFDRIEAFAHPEERGRAEGFHISDFLLGALLMLAVVLTVALVIL